MAKTANWVCHRCAGSSRPGMVEMARYGDGRSTERIYWVTCPACKGIVKGKPVVAVEPVEPVSAVPHA